MRLSSKHTPVKETNSQESIQTGIPTLEHWGIYDNRSGQATSSSDLNGINTEGVVQCVEDLEAKGETPGKTAVLNRLKTFKASTAISWQRRPAIWRRADSIVKTAISDIECKLTSISNDEIIVNVINALNKIEEAREDSGTKYIRSGPRGLKYEEWKKSLSKDLYEIGLDARLKNETAALSNQSGTLQTDAIFIDTDDELTPMGDLKANNYAAINQKLRKGDESEQQAGKLHALQVFAQLRERTNNATPMHVNVTVKRSARTFFNGKKSKPKTEEIQVDKGWSFFEKGNYHDDNKPIKLQVVLKRAILINSNLYGPHESKDEWWTPPGSQFQYTGEENGYYNFTQL